MRSLVVGEFMEGIIYLRNLRTNLVLKCLGSEILRSLHCSLQRRLFEVHDDGIHLSRRKLSNENRQRNS